MIPRFSGRALAAGSAFALALALAGCGSGGQSDLNQVAAATANTPLPQVAAPNNGDWTQVTQETPEGGYRMGNADAPVKLVEYASISCPACGSFSNTAYHELTDRYVKSGQVSWEYRPFLIGPTDPGIFLLLRCQGPQPFFALTEQLYATQNEWLQRAKSLPASQLQALGAMEAQQQVGALAKAIGMDQFFRQRGMPQARVDQCLSDPAGLNRLAEIHSAGMRDVLRGTPTFLINGTPADAVTWPELEPQLRAAIGS